MRLYPLATTCWKLPAPPQTQTSRLILVTAPPAARPQDTLGAIQCPPYCSREAQGVEVPRLLTGNDVWMLAHVLLVLAFRSAMPTRVEDGKTLLVYPGERDAAPAGSGAAAYEGYLLGAPTLSQRTPLTTSLARAARLTA